jgi:hypothetical protein
VHPSATGDFATTDNCPNPLDPSLSLLVVGCTINVTFTPSTAGPRTGTLSTGTLDVTGLLPGPSVALSGAGVPPSSRTGGAGTAPRRKCKKRRHHRSAQAAKKHCKKKKRK